MTTTHTPTTTRIGVVGNSALTFNPHLAEQTIRDAFDIIADDGADSYVVVSGLADVGIPAIAYREATRRGWATEGVACIKATAHHRYPVNVEIIEGSEWGDESETFLSRCDVLVRVGGGGQAHGAADAFHAAGGTVYEYELDPVEA